MSADKPANGGRFLEGDAGIISGVFTTVGSLPYGVADDAGTGVCGGREGEEEGRGRGEERREEGRRERERVEEGKEEG